MLAAETATSAAQPAEYSLTSRSAYAREQPVPYNYRGLWLDEHSSSVDPKEATRVCLSG